MSLVKFELQSILNELRKINSVDYLPIGVHSEIKRTIDNIELSIEMLEVFHGASKGSMPTEENTAYARYEDSKLTLSFNGGILDRVPIDKGPGLMSIVLDTCALRCNSSDIEFLRVEIDRGTLDCQAMDMNEYLERLTAFSATTNAIVIMPPELVMAIKLSNKEEPAKNKQKPTVSSNEDETAMKEDKD